ncbi:mini-chromosome maintenance complex-binding protein-like isoform X1 [Salvia splendens]|uniref:mini-chromosome maintenance complex-binding protein-like isoform X1 n=1 Tax=Salvia splendens TaxID=180675 RepID=UPI00110428A0|nr:mini-chromosome maintenance complex-binding protein-like isoform X1 [Salvia splendens]
MVGLPYDCLANPLGAVRSTFDKAMSSDSSAAALDGKDWGAAEVFRQFLFDDGGLSQVPWLSSSTMKWVQPNTLVRFRGMIQDMLGNEFYVGAYKDGDKWITNKFADGSHGPSDASSDVRIWERRLLYCTPVPGQNSWVECAPDAMRNPYISAMSPLREKRQREDEATESDADMVEPGHAIEDSPNPKKMREDGVAFEPFNLQKVVTEGSTSNSSTPPVERNSVSCLVKIYDSPESDLKLNEVFEFVGIFTFDPDLTVPIDDKEVMDDFCEDELLCLPPSKVPRLHCVVHRKLGPSDLVSSPHLELTTPVIKEIREALIGHLTAVLGGDRLPAEYILLHLLSRVHARVDEVAVGKLSLNLTCFNKENMSVFGNNLKLVIGSLMPFTECLPLTVDYLNSVTLAPKKDYNTNRLVSGLLQLAEGSHLTIDETPLQSGTLNSGGLENAQVLRSMMESQKVHYDFTYYKMEMPADVQFLILSEGKSNILPADLVLPFHPSSVDPASGVDGEMLKAWRWYLATMKSLPHSIDPPLQKAVEDDLVAARQADRSLSREDFSRWLTMGRLMSVSFGATSLSMEHWQMVKELERLRKNRFQGNL